MTTTFIPFIPPLLGEDRKRQQFARCFAALVRVERPFKPTCVCSLTLFCCMATTRYSGAQRMMSVVQALYLRRVASAFGMWFEVIREHNMVTEQVCALMLCM